MDYCRFKNDITELREALVNFANAIGKAIETTVKPFVEGLSELFDNLEPYQKQEVLHPRKKPRGSIRRRRQGRI